LSTRILKYLLNPLSLIGVILAAIGFGASLFALVVDVLHGASSPYQGLLTFVLFPSIFLLGLFLVSVVALLVQNHRRRLERKHLEWKPMLDPGLRRHRLILTGLGAFAVVAFLSSLVGAYHAFEFTESTEFCGQLCHTPMEPQHVAHQNTAHAGVACTTCHVGPGILGFVEAKMAGLRQLYQMVGTTYPRPIFASERKVDITSDTCERCHWREKLWSPRFDGYSRFGYDIQNSRRSFHLLTRPSGSRRFGSEEAPVHWHAEDEKITFRAADARHQAIPWVQVVRADGQSVVYEDQEWKARAEVGTLLPEEPMECIDCHSRPAHRFLTPDESINRALTAGSIDRSLPSIKRAVVAALARAYESRAAAEVGIRREIEAFYTANFQGAILARKESLEKAIQEVTAIHGRSAFPAMKVDWSTHPDNSGHRESPGCFRCHSGRHVSQDGKALSNDCTICHLFYERATDSMNHIEVPADGSTLHPFRVADHAKVACWTCHSGTTSPYATCTSCHPAAAVGHSMKFECSICHKPGSDRVGSGSCGPCHPVGGSALHANVQHADCVACHAPHDWKVAAAEKCTGCHATIAQASWQAHHPGQGCTTTACHDFRGVLSQLQGLPAGAR
jgi:hypothetical protein